jgi:hypothetical protein
MVLFPEPDVPTIAVVLPFSNLNEKLFITWISFLEG